MKKLAIIAALALCATPAVSCDLRDLPWQAHAANVAVAADIGTTMYCLHRDRCQEGNPMYGKHPSDLRLVTVGVARISFNTAATCFLEDRNPRLARIFSTVNLVVTGGVVAANLRFAF